MQPIVANYLAEFGYSYTYLIFGIVSLVVSIPIALIFIILPKPDEEALNKENCKNNEFMSLSKVNINPKLQHVKLHDEIQ